MPGGGIHVYDRFLERLSLDNGLKVLLAPNRLAPVVAVQAWVGVGSAVESAKQAGLAHVLEHMLFKGTERRGVGEIASEVEGAGGEINAWTSFNETVYHVVLASRYLDTALDVLGDVLQNPAFDSREIEREREVILEEIKQSRDDPMRRVAQALFSTAYTRHPYRRPVIGSAGVVGKVSRRRLVDFYSAWYVANNVTLVISGDFDPRTIEGKVNTYFGKMPARPLLARRRQHEPQQAEARVVVETQDVNEAHLALGFHIPSLRDHDTPALDLAAIILGQGESSRLSAEILRERELVTSVYSYAHTLRDRGLFVVSATLRPENLGKATEAIASEVFRLAGEEVRGGELDKARHAVEADTVYQVETMQGLARKFGFYEAVAGGAEFEADYLGRTRRTTAASIRTAAARHLAVVNTTVVALLPDRGRHRSDRGREAEGKRLLTQLKRAATRVGRDSARAALPSLRRSDDPDLVREVLGNGLRVVIKRDTSVPIVASRAVWMGGSRLETARNNGISNLLAATITRGCGGRTATEISQLVDELAGTLAGSSGRNSFSVRSEWLARNWEQGFDLMADCIIAPDIDEAEIDRERRRVVDELSVRRDDPGFLAIRLFAETLYRRHPYRLDILGTEASVAELDRKRIISHYRRYLPVSELTLAFAGDVDPARVLDRVRARLGEVPRRGAPARKVPGEEFGSRSPESRRVRRHLDREQAHLVIGFPGTTLDDSDRFALEVMTTILGGQGGRLFIELRDRRALAYRVGAMSMEGIDPGYIATYLACSPEKLDEAMLAVRGELDRVADHGVTVAEVERAITYLLGVHEISLQRRGVLASAIAFHEAYGLGYDQHRRFAEMISAVGRADVQRVAARYLDWDLAITASVEPSQVRRAGRAPAGARRQPVGRARAARRAR